MLSECENLKRSLKVVKTIAYLIWTKPRSAKEFRFHEEHKIGQILE